MNKTQMKAQFRSFLHDPTAREKNKGYILDVFNKYRLAYGYPKAEKLKVQKSVKYSNNLQFVTEHGTLSYLKAVDHFFGKAETPVERFRKAARHHMHEYMMAFRRNNMPEYCPHTNIKLNFNNSHVDHVGKYEFSDIVRLYLEQNDLSKIEYVNTRDGTAFKHKEDKQKFREFHDSLAVLEVVHAKHNLSRGKK